jgi:hypothetical protein
MTDLSYKNKSFIKSLLIKEPDTNLRTIYKLVKSLNTKEISNESIKQYVSKIRDSNKNKQIFKIVKSFKGGNIDNYDPTNNPILFFRGGDDITIQNKLIEFYKKTDNAKTIVWNVSPNINTNYFFYIEVNDNIVASVRVNDVDHELDMGFVEKDYRNKGYFIPLLKKRLEYVMENKKDMYVLYTEVDRLKKKHEEVGMTLNPSIKVQVNGVGPFYWKFEYNRPAKDLIIKFNVSGENCSGYMIGKNNDKSLINTAMHCILTGQNMNDPNKTTHAIIPNIELKTINNAKHTLLRNNVNLSKFDNIKRQNKYIADIDDSIIINSPLLLDTSNVYILTNPENLLDDYEVSYWGKTTNNWTKIKINRNINHLSIIDATKLTAKQINDDDIPKYITFLKDNILGGDSGGPVGIFFGIDNKKFALIGNITGGTVINTYQRIKDTDIKHFVNLASYTDIGINIIQQVETKIVLPNAQIMGPSQEPPSLPAVEASPQGSPSLPAIAASPQGPPSLLVVVASPSVAASTQGPTSLPAIAVSSQGIVSSPSAPASSAPASSLTSPAPSPSVFSNNTIDTFINGFDKLDNSVQQITRKIATLKQELDKFKTSMAGGAIQTGGANIVKDINTYKEILTIVNKKALLKEFIAETYKLLTDLWDPKKNMELKNYLNNNLNDDEIQKYFIKDNDKYYFSDVIFTKIMLGQLNSDSYPNNITKQNLKKYYNKKNKK